MPMVLLDSNIVIYMHSAGSDSEVAVNTVAAQVVAVSAISRVETLGFHEIGREELEALEAFFAVVATFSIDDEIIDLAATLRRRHRRMSLGDAIIAATAVSHGLHLVTRNDRDFDMVAGLQVINPYRTC